MEHKSLRQLARELGISASYLSQVTHGKKRLSMRVASALASVNQSVNQLGVSSTQDLATRSGAVEARRANNSQVVGSNQAPATDIIIFNRRCNMALGKIDHMDFTVGDLEKAEEYFTEKLGF